MKALFGLTALTLCAATSAFAQTSTQESRDLNCKLQTRRNGIEQEFRLVPESSEPQIAVFYDGAGGLAASAQTNQKKQLVSLSLTVDGKTSTAYIPGNGVLLLSVANKDVSEFYSLTCERLK